MKSIILSTATILLVVVTVISSSVYLSHTLSNIEAELDALIEEPVEFFDGGKDEILAIYEKFKAREGLLSLMLGDALLSDIEIGFLNAISYAEVGEVNEALVSVTRLSNDVENARKLAELSLMSVF